MIINDQKLKPPEKELYGYIFLNYIVMLFQLKVAVVFSNYWFYSTLSYAARLYI